MKKIKWIVITGACFSAVTIAIAKKAPGKQSGTDYEASPTSETASQPVPDHTVYRSLLHKIVHLQERTNELQLKGKIATNSYYALQDEANLNSGQLRALSRIASAGERDATTR